MAMVMEGAQVETGPESLETAMKLIEEFGLPGGLLPFENVVECGYVKETGYVWITQKKAIQHVFKKISKTVSYEEKITAYLEKGRLKKLTGVKAKELFWVSIVEISLANPDSQPSEDGKVHFKSFAGIESACDDAQWRKHRRGAASRFWIVWIFKGYDAKKLGAVKIILLYLNNIWSPNLASAISGNGDQALFCCCITFCATIGGPIDSLQCEAFSILL